MSSDQPTLRDAHAEARAVLEELGHPSLDARVLEPSPPAVAVDPFADDPAAVGPAEPSSVVTPTSAGAHTWRAIVDAHPEIATFAADRWLAAWRRLPEVPAGFAQTRDSLHLVAFYLMAQARRQVNGRIGLRWTRGGFGTPFFGDDVQVRVEHVHVVVQTRHGVRFDTLSTLRRAGTLIGLTPRGRDREHFDVPELGDVDAEMRIDPRAVAFLDSWFGLSASVLEELRVDGSNLDPGRVQLWPEHFDLAVDLGDADSGRRATFGASPGDATHAEPYFYVAAWEPVDRDEPYWNDPAFNGASLLMRELAGAEDQRATALAFLQRGLAVINRP
ncbi:MAG TPA: hypothetical protein VGQ20_03410 [Acidimicrobiales bacterium]|nr:hypothetical protein [Acidimicrobiales bacterium]